ncbi:MAG: D-alanyl-D-alanine endopeptidase, partial [Chania sp.]
MHVKIRVLVLTLLALQVGTGLVPRALASEKTAALHATQPELASGSAMVLDMQTHKVIYARNPDEVVPIASITKLMTAMVTLDAHLPLDEV